MRAVCQGSVLLVECSVLWCAQTQTPCKQQLAFFELPLDNVWMDGQGLLGWTRG